MTVAYLDASAVIGGFVGEGDEGVSSVLAALDGEGFTFVSSTLTTVEVRRYLHRVRSRDVDHDAAAMLGGTGFVAIDGTAVAVAGSITAQHLGALDAIHLATALLVRADVMVTRDRQLARAADAAGITVL